MGYALLAEKGGQYGIGASYFLRLSLSLSPSLSQARGLIMCSFILREDPHLGDSRACTHAATHARTRARTHQRTLEPGVEAVVPRARCCGVPARGACARACVRARMRGVRAPECVPPCVALRVAGAPPASARSVEAVAASAIVGVEPIAERDSSATV